MNPYNEIDDFDYWQHLEQRIERDAEYNLEARKEADYDERMRAKEEED